MSHVFVNTCARMQLPPTAKAVLMCMAHYANEHGECWPGIQTISEFTCFGKTAVIAGIKSLEGMGVLTAHRSASRSNIYVITPDGFTGERSGDFHYVYRITHVATGQFYIGLRSGTRAPEADDYWGSGKDCAWLQERKDECRREVLATFATRLEAAQHETALLSTAINDPDCLNRRMSTPEQALANAPRLANESTPPERSVSRTVRLPNHQGASNEPDSSASRTSMVREADPNHQDTSRHIKKQVKQRADALPCPDDVSPQTWADWLALRKAKKAPVTETVVKQARNEARKAGITFEAFLAVWCARGSQGLQADWLKPSERAGPAPGRFTQPESPPSKTLSAIQQLQGMKHGNQLDSRRNSGRPEPAALLESGSDPGSGHDRWDGDGLASGGY